MGDNAQIIIAAISMIGGVIGTYLTVKYKNSRTGAHAPTQAERESSLYDGYERLIKQIEGNLAAVKHDLEESEQANSQLRDKVETLGSTVEELRNGLASENARNNLLRADVVLLLNTLQSHGIDTTQIELHSEIAQ